MHLEADSHAKKTGIHNLILPKSPHDADGPSGTLPTISTPRIPHLIVVFDKKIITSIKDIRHLAGVRLCP